MTLPAYELELKANEERLRLQASVHELKQRMRDALNPEKAVRQHLAAFCGGAAAVACVAGGQET
jgi:PIN domain nuclease of toxin-antitoxin system